MQTIHLQIQDNLYDKLIKSGVNIQEKFNETLYDMFDDGYPSISTQEAKKEWLMLSNNTKMAQCKQCLVMICGNK